MFGFGKKKAPRVLVADDDPFIRGVITAHLAAENLESITADDGVEALEAARRERPDLILLDADMPGMDGWETLLKLGADGRTASIPVLMCTADDSVTSLERAFLSKAMGYITKPVRREELLRKVRKALAGSAGVQAGG